MNIIDKLFSDEYINKNAAKNNIIIYLLGRLSYPFAVVFTKIGVTPNQITTLSTLLGISSAVALVYDSGWKLFVLFWAFSLLFDFCDGTVARMTSQVGKTAFRYDHTSDLFKIFIVILGVSIRYNDVFLWAVSMSASFFFMFFTVLNHDYSFVARITNLVDEKKEATSIGNDEISLKQKIKDYISDSNFEFIVINIYMIIFTINGHSLLVFLLFCFGRDTSLSVMIYLMLLSIKGAYQNINKLKLRHKQ